MVLPGGLVKPILAIVGPTATGKSDLAVKLAKKYDGEVISADAFQLYKRMDIGTAKIKKTEMQGVRHHLIDILEPNESFSASDYQKMVREKIELVSKEGRMPIVVGGSGFYIKAALYEYEFPGEKRNDELTAEYSDYDNSELYGILEKQDPQLAKTIHPNNRRRILRSLEIVGTGSNEFRKKGSIPFYDNILLIGLTMDRKELYKQIDERVDRMIEKGLVEEAKALFDAGITGQSISAIGYKELFMFFRNEIRNEEAFDLIKRNSRRYAKRQLTWFKNQMDVTWFDVTNDNRITLYDEIVNYIEKKGEEI